MVDRNSEFAIISKAVLFCAVNTLLLKLSLLLTSSIPGFSNNFLSSTIGPILALLVTYLFLKFDKKSFSNIGLRFEFSKLKKFSIGFLIGIIVMGVFVLSIVYSAGFTIQVNKNASILFLLVNALPTIIMLAFMEELIFRAYPLIVIKNKAGKMPALVITSILFGLYHLVFGWGITGFFSTSIWGLAFALLAISSNGISMPTGFHSAGNFIQMALGTTGSIYSIWNVASNDELPVKNVSNNQSVVISHLVVLFIIICMIRLFKNQIASKAYNDVSGTDIANYKQ